MEIEEFCRLYPRLYHIAANDSWPSIRLHGLLPSDQLVQRCALDLAESDLLLANRRPQWVRISGPQAGPFMLRDQRPLSVSKLSAALTDMDVPSWLRMLNSYVFFWPQAQRRDRMLQAYSGESQQVLEIDTASLMAAHGDSALLSRINSGSTAYVAQPRGSNTFVPLTIFEHPPRRRALAGATDVAELCIPGGVPDIFAHVLRVNRYVGPRAVALIWDRLGSPETSPATSP